MIDQLQHKTLKVAAVSALYSKLNPRIECA